MKRNPIMTARAASIALDRYESACAVGGRTRWARRQAGITQAELGDAIDRSATTIRNIEAGKRALSPLERVAVARALGVGLGFLRDGRPAIALGPATPASAPSEPDAMAALEASLGAPSERRLATFEGEEA